MMDYRKADHRLTPTLLLPQRLEELLSQHGELHGRVLTTLARFGPWFEDNKLTFFPEYTDHGVRHVNQVMNTAAALLIDTAWSVITPGDAAAIAIGALLHDCAMHLSEDGFLALVEGASSGLIDGDVSWPQLWRAFIAEASRFDGRTLRRLFGEPVLPLPVPLLRGAMNERHRMLVGEFLRRHHARLAHEIARWGVPGPDERRLSIEIDDLRLRDLFGLIARSHNLPIRAAVERLQPMHRRDSMGVHAPYVMAVLRIADYVQIERDRAPGQIPLVRSLSSPVSRGEWRAHSAISSVSMSAPDRETLVVEAYPDDAATYVKLRTLFDAMQRELDETWAVLGEVYGAALTAFGLTVRRIRSSFDDVENFAHAVRYVPTLASFDVAGADTLRLLIRPLYGERPEIGIRELIQNAVDAVRERADADAAFQQLVERAHVRVAMVTQPDGTAVLTVSDDGVGMTPQTIVNYYLKAGATFRESERWRVTHTDSTGASRVARSGRFGVGLLAAFLLGERLDVTTRHYTSAEGIQFSAGIHDEVIELRRVNSEIGTTVRVTIDDRQIVRRLVEHPSLWDWYCVDWPTVVRSIDGDFIAQSHLWPGEGSELPMWCRRITVEGFADVHWSVWRDFSPGRPLIICNGIRVNNQMSHYASLRPLFHRGIPYELTVEPASISVFDREGQFPLTLQRTELTQNLLPFHDTLRDDVIKDFVAFAVCRLPENGWRFREYPGLKTNRTASKDLNWYQFWRSERGWSLSDIWALSVERPVRAYVVTPSVRHQLPSGIAVLQVDHDAPPSIIKYCLGRHGKAVGPFRVLKPIGGRAAFHSGHTTSIRASSCVQVDGGWLFAVWGEVQGSDDEFLSLLQQHAAKVPDVVAEMFFTFEATILPQSPVATLWEGIVGGPTMPMSHTERASIRRHPEIREYVDRYRAMDSDGEELVSTLYAEEEFEIDN